VPCHPIFIAAFISMPDLLKEAGFRSLYFFCHLRKFIRLIKNKKAWNLFGSLPFIIFDKNIHNESNSLPDIIMRSVCNDIFC
jgi:hypothetical protein